MIRTNKLRAIIVENNMTQQQVAEEIGISPKTFYCKMTKGIFGSDEIEKMILVLNIQDPMSIFFTLD